MKAVFKIIILVACILATALKLVITDKHGWYSYPVSFNEKILADIVFCALVAAIVFGFLYEMSKGLVLVVSILVGSWKSLQDSLRDPQHWALAHSDYAFDVVIFGIFYTAISFVILYVVYEGVKYLRRRNGRAPRHRLHKLRH